MTAGTKPYEKLIYIFDELMDIVQAQQKVLEFYGSENDYFDRRPEHRGAYTTMEADGGKIARGTVESTRDRIKKIHQLLNPPTP